MVVGSGWTVAGSLGNQVSRERSKGMTALRARTAYGM
jgi:hypothetical protein